MRIQNAKDWATLYSCKFLEAGIVSYEDSDAGIALLKKETIDRMAQSFVGKPVIVNHQDVDESNFEKVAVGYVTRVWFCPDDAWFYADFIVTNDAAKDLIDNKGWSVSCAFNVLDVAEGGLWHDIKFDGEITDGSFTHLALVESPRYEESRITKQLPAMLVNGKEAHYKQQTEDSKMFKIFKKKENDKQEDITNLHVSIDGVDVPVTDVIASYMNSKEKEKKNEKDQKYMAKDEDLIDINGHKVSIGEMKAAYTASKKNEKMPDNEEKAKEIEKKNDNNDDTAKETKNQKDEEIQKKKDEDIKNAKEEEEKAKKEAEEKDKKKENAKKQGEEFFAELKNAGKQFINDEGETPAPKSRLDRANMWAAKHKR